jgi:N-acetylglucosaminyldiphosphoundecaprenol N-acetyl-beta-D-mannosaminyltransferase
MESTKPIKSQSTGLGVNIETWKEAKDALRVHIASLIPAQVITLTPEMCVRSAENPDFRKIIKEAEFVVADGVGVVWGQKHLTSNTVEKIPGIDLASWALEDVDRIAGKVYLIGSKPDVVEKAAVYVSTNYPRLKVAGFSHGYFSDEEESAVVEKASVTKSNLILVGMGSPKQEIFIASNLDKFHCGIAIGIGGSFDVWSGSAKRAPEIFRKTSTEWLYRTFTQPSDRLKRIPILWKFVVKVLKRQI